VGTSRRELGEALSLLADCGRRPARRRVFTWGLGACWLVLAAFCVHVVLTVRGLRGDVAERVAWISDAEGGRGAARRAVLDAVHAEPDADRVAIAAGIERELRPGANAGELRAAAVAWRDADAAGVDAAPERLARASAAYDDAIALAVQAVRADIAGRSRRLGELWDHLYLLAFACIGLGGAFTLVFARALRQREKLELGTRAQRKLIETVRSVLYVVSADGKIVFINEAARHVYGYAPEELIGRPFGDILDDAARGPGAGTFERVLRGDTVFNFESAVVHRTGRRVPVLCNAAALRDARGNVLGCIGTAADISELKSMQQQLVRNERQHALGTMASGVAHDFSNLLTVILGKAEREIGDRGPSRRLEAIRDTTERARRIVERLLVFSEQRSAARSRLGLAATLERMEGFLGGLVGERGAVVLRLPGREVFVDADWSQVEQVVMNLVLNARDAIAPGGEVIVGVNRIEVGGARARELGIEPGDWASLVVADDGAGMDGATLGRAFEPFFTTKERGQGTGLGLATVQGIVEQHGGVVSAESRAGEGTVVTVLLPLSVPAPVPV